jgi:GT2 family glycosyltransferase
MEMVQYKPALNPAKNPLCSVCIANFNGIDTLAECLDSLPKQDCDFEVEIIVHDDASTDESVSYIQQHYPDVELLISKENCGFCVSNNRMVEIARGEFILLLNNDAALYPDALRSLHEYAKQQSINGILGLPQYDMQNGELIDRGFLHDPFLNPLPNLDNNRQQVAQVIGACLWIPKTLWQELGGFPEWFHTLAEDMFICCYARLKSYPVEVLTHSGFKHWLGKSLGGGKVSANQLRTTVYRRALSERNKTFVMILCYPAPLAWLLIPLHLILLTVEGLLLTLIKRQTLLWKEIYWNCMKEIWLKRKVLWITRRHIQRDRHISSRAFFTVHTLIPHKLRMLVKYGIPEVNRK